MKIKINSKQISTLKSLEGYRKWKQEVTMLVKALRYPRLLNVFFYNPNSSFSSSSHTQDTSHTLISTISPDTPLEISRQRRGGKGGKDDIIQEDWIQMSEQIVSQLFFFLIPIYKSHYLQSCAQKSPFSFYYTRQDVHKQ
jgi:hypothetical protein